MNVLKAVRTRRSIGKLKGDVGPKTIRTLVEAAIWAPNHRLTKPWTFTVVRGDARVRLGEVWASQAVASAALEGDERKAFEEREARKTLRAPVLLFVSTRTDDDLVVAAEDFAATAAAVQNVLLVAHELKLGAMWRTGGMAYSDEIKTHLGLDARDRIVGIVYLGRPDMKAPKSGPRDVGEVLRVLT